MDGVDELVSVAELVPLVVDVPDAVSLAELEAVGVPDAVLAAVRVPEAV